MEITAAIKEKIPAQMMKPTFTFRIVLTCLMANSSCSKDKAAVELPKKVTHVSPVHKAKKPAGYSANTFGIASII
jgi:hypothetical protein